MKCFAALEWKQPNSLYGFLNKATWNTRLLFAKLAVYICAENWDFLPGVSLTFQL